MNSREAGNLERHLFNETKEIQTDFTIIIVSWNAKHFLSQCLLSCVRAISGYDAEIIVVDNASADGSAEFVLEHYPNVKVIRNCQNLGFAKGNNVGIKESSGRYLFLINSDVTVMEGCIDRMKEFMDKNPQIGMLGPQILNQYGEVQRSCMEFPSLWNTLSSALALYRIFPRSKKFGGGQIMSYWKHDTIKKVDVINGCFWMVRREALDEVGLLDERFFMYGEDIDWCKRFHHNGWKVVFLPSARAIHNGGASSSNAPVKFYVEKQKANLQLWTKYHSRSSQLTYVVICILHHVVRVLGHIFRYLGGKRGRENAALKISRSTACISWLIKNGLKKSIS